MKQITCNFCGDTYPDFDVAHVCSRGPYAPRLKPKMNERIRELADESGIGYLSSVHPSMVEKFAELIIEECGRALNPLVQNRNVISRGQAYDLIKQHFGVEE